MYDYPISVPSSSASKKRSIFSPNKQQRRADGDFSTTFDDRAPPFKDLHNQFPIALADPNRIRDSGVDVGHAFSGSHGTHKYAYRLMSPSNNTHSRQGDDFDVMSSGGKSTFSQRRSLLSSSKKARTGFQSMHALDGLTTYVSPARKEQKLFAKPMIYTMKNSQAAQVETVPAGIVQTPGYIHTYKRTVFDFRGTPLVNIMENEPEVRPPPQ